MADDKIFFTESDKKTTEQIVEILALLLILGAVAAALLAYLDTLNFGIFGDWWRYFLERIWPLWKLIAAILSILALAGIIHNLLKLREIELEEQPIYNPLPVGVVSDEGEIVEVKNERWEQVLKYANSENDSDWRQAIIEADVMLEELLRTSGYVGESVGEMLKSVDKSDFLTIEDAWDAHKTRNAVAHSGTDFRLNNRETRHTIAQFERVFREFEII